MRGWLPAREREGVAIAGDYESRFTASKKRGTIASWFLRPLGEMSERIAVPTVVM